jgi:hypothetical protein
VCDRLVRVLAEAAHSVADSTNELMLAFSLHRARRPADGEHTSGEVFIDLTGHSRRDA